MNRQRPAFLHLSISIFALVLLMYPGQNTIQTYKLVNQNSQVKGIYYEVEYSPLPKRNINTPIPTLSSESAIVVDVDSASILYEKDPDKKLMPASTTKIMTALIALEEFKKDETITIKNESRSIGNTSELISGETLTVEDMVAALLIPSGNDAALALAQHHEDGYQEFVDKMNLKASDLHMENTSFSNVSGLEQPSHFTTVRDLANLTKEVMKIDLIREFVATEKKIITSTDGKYSHVLESTNQLLGSVSGVRGVKTGWTLNAGECLITSTIRDGHEIIVVVLGSEDRFGESKYLIEWVYKNHTWIPFPDLNSTTD